MNLDNLAFVDIETSGSNALYDRIIEIGILRVENNQLVRTYNQLINSQQPLPSFIENITGIRTADLVDAPTFEEVKEEILEVLDNCIFVAHNVRFDYSFLKNEFRRYGIPFSAKQFCTVKLSRHLYPQFTKHNLDALMQRFELACDHRHRAFDDAKVLWDFYQKIQTQFPDDHVTQAIHTIMRKPALPVQLAPDTLDLLPENSGVYIFYGENDVPLYVGKSINVRERVASHFANDHASETEMQISKQIQRIEVIDTAGELGALMKESELIKKLQPIYNRQLRLQTNYTIALKVENKDGYHSLELKDVKQIFQSDLSQIMAFFGNKKQAKERLVDICNKHALCEKILGLEKGSGACFGYKIEQCHGACVGEEEPLKYNLRFAEAFYHSKIKSWPFVGPVLIREKDEFLGIEEVFLIDNWCVLGSQTFDLTDRVEEGWDLQTTVEKLNQSEDPIPFQLDTYKILTRYIFNLKNQKNIHLSQVKSL